MKKFIAMRERPQRLSDVLSERLSLESAIEMDRGEPIARQFEGDLPV